MLETLTPAERLAFVLHDMFARAVRRDRADRRSLTRRGTTTRQPRPSPRAGWCATVPDADRARQREVVDAFLAASRGGDFDALLALLDPDVVLHADLAAVQSGATGEVRGAPAVAETFAGRARRRPAGADRRRRRPRVGTGGRPRVVFDLTIEDGKIVEIDMVADTERLGELDLVVLDD